MSHSKLVWPDGFRTVYDRALKSYRSGPKRADTLFSAEEKTFLAGIGCSAQELFDFVEDYCNSDEPTYETVLLVTSIRRRYFRTMQQGKTTGKLASMGALPPKDAQVSGVRWLPRIIEKARIKLRGEMPAELMYGCGGDRPFLRSMNLELADFLQLVWDCGDDNQKIVNAVIAARDGTPRSQDTIAAG